MTFLVAYDGSPLARSALLRAADFAGAVDDSVHTVTVIPADGILARERGWLLTADGFDRSLLEERVTEDVRSYTPGATVHVRFAEKRAPRGRITREIRNVAYAEDIDVLFVGSESAGHLVTGLSSVGQGVAYGRYDLHVVRRIHPDLDTNPTEQSPRSTNDEA